MTETKGMLVTLSTNSRAPQLQTELDLVDNYKFLGVYVDNILSFNKHVDYVIDKASKRFYALLQLKRLGVSTEKLALFYVSNIRSVLVYCIASFFSQLNDKQKESLERVQSLCSKIILPNIESYSERLEVLAIPNLCAFSLEQYRCHFFKILNNPDHVLHSFIPERQSTNRRHSARCKDVFVTRYRTTKYQNSFFNFGLNKFT